MNAHQVRSQAVRAAARTKWYDSPWRIIAGAFGSALAIIAIGALLAILVVPRLLGGDSLTVLSGSMEPTFSPGDVVVVKGVKEADVCSDVSVGSIVTYFPEPNDPTLITHRVIGKTIGTFEDGTGCRLVTQGDANTSVDAPISPAQVRGVFMYGIPGLGWVRQWVSQHPLIVGATAVAALIGWVILGSLRKPRTTVVRVSQPSASGTESSASLAREQTPAVAPERELRELREREFALRERELELRERELTFALETQAHAKREAAVHGTRIDHGDFENHQVEVSPRPAQSRSRTVPIMTTRNEA